MKMRSNTSCSFQNNHRNTWGMKALKMCFGKGRLKPCETMEQGNKCVLNSNKL